MLVPDTNTRARCTGDDLLTYLQALVLYDGEVCLGAATIVSRGPSAYDVAHPNPVKQQHQRQQQHADEQQPPPRGGRVHRLGTTGSVEV